MVATSIKDQVFARLDAIAAGEIPVADVGTLEEESTNLTTNNTTFKKYGKEWVGARFPEVPPEERQAKLAEYYGFGARRVALYKHLDAIEAGQVPVAQIGLREEEARAFCMAENRYMGCGLNWVDLRHPEVPPERRRAKFREFYGIGPRRVALFKHLDAIDAGTFPFNEVG